MAMHGKVASRYARAIFELIKGSNGAGSSKVLKELQAFEALMHSHAELRQVLTTPSFSSAERRGVVEDLAKKMKLSELTFKILIVLSEAGRLNYLESVVDTVDSLLRKESDVASLKVRAATKLTADEKEKIESKFHTVLGKKVHASYEIDPTLIGGLHIAADGRTFDGSLAGWLNTFEEQLVGRAH